MGNDVVQVPVSLLRHGDLPAAAKLVWMGSELERPGGQAGLAAALGISRPTVIKGLADLASATWDPTGATVPVPIALITNQNLSNQARVLYGMLLLTPGFSHPCGRFTYAELGSLAHASRNTVAKALDELVHAEWVKADRASRLDQIHIELTIPGLTRGMNALARAQRRLERAPFFGEALMREYLSLLVNSEEYTDAAAPGFLTNPRTDAPLELDRFYPPSVAFEHNGPQHYRATDRFTAEESAAQQERDYIKLGICLTRGITLVIIQPEDLSLDRMRQKIGSLLPLRDLTGYDPLIDYLESESRQYRRSMARLRPTHS